ncbi:phage shock protein C [Anaerotaenia torta]|uniref:PspC domain-containing protein n=1 Tax=Anaerotaenia torta TaxID=433293 RepID=UPI003D1D762C
MEQKKLYRSTSNKMLCGVCGGVAEYFNVDPTIVRLAWAAVCLFAGAGIIAYIIAAIIVPVQI